MRGMDFRLGFVPQMGGQGPKVPTANAVGEPSPSWRIVQCSSSAEDSGVMEISSFRRAWANQWE